MSRLIFYPFPNLVVTSKKKKLRVWKHLVFFEALHCFFASENTTKTNFLQTFHLGIQDLDASQFVNSFVVKKILQNLELYPTHHTHRASKHCATEGFRLVSTLVYLCWLHCLHNTFISEGHCPLTSNQHQNSNPCKQHQQEFSKSLPFKIYVLSWPNVA